MFPVYEVAITEERNEAHPRGKTFAFDFADGDFVMQDGRLVPLTGAEGLKVWVEKCLRTTAKQYSIYLQDAQPYGVNSVDLTTRRYPYAFLCAELQREITDALLRSSEIVGVDRFTFTREGRTLSVAFTVRSIYGEEQEERRWQIA